jgi:hypothetical protein
VVGDIRNLSMICLKSFPLIIVLHL